MKRNNCEIKFETKFRINEGKQKRDVDLTIIDSKGQEFHVEVYMPTLECDIDGFSSLDEGDSAMLKKIKGKILNKFGERSDNGLIGRVVLALNFAYFDLFRVKQTLNIALRNELVGWFESGMLDFIDGLIIFVDDFSSSNSFVCLGEIAKPNNELRIFEK